MAVPPEVATAFERLPPVMARADALASRVDRAVIDLAETVLLTGREGSEFQAVVIVGDEKGARFQLLDQPVVARVAEPSLAPGTRLAVRLDTVDPIRRGATFTRIG